MVGGRGSQGFLASEMVKESPLGDPGCGAQLVDRCGAVTPAPDTIQVYVQEPVTSVGKSALGFSGKLRHKSSTTGWCVSILRFPTFFTPAAISQGARRKSPA